MVAVMEGLHHDAARLGGQFGDLAGFGGVGGERFFAQHVLTGGQRGAGPAAVQAVGQRVVDGIEVGIGDQRLVTFVHPGDAVFRGKSLCTCAVAGCYCGDDDLTVSLGRLDKRRRRDARRAQDADPQATRLVSSHGRSANTGHPARWLNFIARYSFT